MKSVVLFIIFAQFLFANGVGISVNGGKYGSIDTFRLGVSKAFDEPIYSGDIVNKIRQKTYYEIVKNHSSRGYTIDILRK